MATTGYRIEDNTTANDGVLQHTAQTQIFYGPASTWWGVIFNHSATADHWLMKYDGTLPASQGDVGSWDRADAVTTKNDVSIEDRNSASVDVFWESGSSELHVISNHGTEQYHLFSYNSGTDDWNSDVTDESPGGSWTSQQSSFAVDSNGKVWLVFIDNATLLLESRVRSNGAGGSWAAASTLEGTATLSGGTSRCSVVAWNNAGTPSIGVFYSWDITAGDKWRFAYRADSDGDTAAWTFEDVSTTVTIDDHCHIQAADFGSDTTSTLIAVGKDASNNVEVWRRTPAGSWESNVQAAAAADTTTRPQVAIDSTNEEAYVFYPDAATDATITKWHYKKSDASTTLSWGSELTVLETNGTDNFAQNCSAPSAAVTGDSDLMFISWGTDDEDAWWNVITLTDPPAAGGSNPSRMALMGAG